MKQPINLRRNLLPVAIMLWAIISLTMSLGAVPQNADIADEVTCDLSFYYWWNANSSFTPSSDELDKTDPTIDVPPPIKLYFQDSAGGWQNVDVPPASRTRPMLYRGPEKLLFYDQVPVRGESAVEPFGQVMIPKDSDSMLLMLTKTSERIKFTGIDNSEEAIPLGRLVLRNYTNSDIAFQMGGEQVIIAAGGSATFPVAPDERSQIRLRGANHKDGKWSVFYTGNVAAHSNSRFLLLVTPGQDRHSVRLMRF